MSWAGEISKTGMTEAEEDEACVMALHMACGSILPMVLKCAIELDLFEIMAKAGPGAYVSPAELAQQLPTQDPDAPDMLDRILRFLACNSVLNCSLRPLAEGRVERLYGLAPICKFFTKNPDGVSIAPLLLIVQDKVFMERFEGLSSVVDVGSGTGATLGMIVSKYPSIKGINFDLPNVLQDAPIYLGVEHVGGDMFVSVPKGDAIIMKWICHDWSDENCNKVLKNCYEALPENGKVIVVESIVPEAPSNELEPKMAINGDLIMLAYSPGGKNRTEKEFEALAKGAGFEGFQVVCRAFNTWIMEYLKKN